MAAVIDELPVFRLFPKQLAVTVPAIDPFRLARTERKHIVMPRRNAGCGAGKRIVKIDQHQIGSGVRCGHKLLQRSCFRIYELHIIAVMVVRKASFALLTPLHSINIHERNGIHSCIFVHPRIFPKCGDKAFLNIACRGFARMMTRGQENAPSQTVAEPGHRDISSFS